MFGFGKQSGAGVPPLPPEEANYADLLACGAYRVFQPAEAERATRLAQDAFPDYAARISCFGRDWLGRMFAQDSARSGQVLMLEPGTGEVLEIPAGYDDFHADDLALNADAVIAYPFFRDWLRNGGARPDVNQCIGYRQPLFVGGKDSVHNLECTDFDSYWLITSQLLAKIRSQS